MVDFIIIIIFRIYLYYMYSFKCMFFVFIIPLNWLNQDNE
jgi:hypothetical protein